MKYEGSMTDAESVRAAVTKFFDLPDRAVQVRVVARTMTSWPEIEINVLVEPLEKN